ncbi:sugar ABC transporter permease [Paenibacillus oenotherae]|uniref:Sugar ABC transporter permease n=1 Tax=Paenibacillus oenotherae TaxID=1435645 RepID=A0ABS7D357_9BACL|nr:sugar ABC transporter permease [Paenibacillus oenotherae]MBW7474359.1 sugar ABC transporter permease [Paenibacillus oenotherae]
MKPRIILSYAIILLLVCAAIYPALWIVMSSFKVGDSLYSESLIPKALTFDHYKELFTSKRHAYATWYKNTLFIAVMSTIIGSFLTLLGSYAIARFRFYGRKQSLMVMLVMNMFPGFMAMIAIFILLLQLNMLDNHWALILVYSSGAFITNVFVAKGFYDTIPRSLEEAARIDGASHFTVFYRVILPLSTPMLTYISLVVFSGSWVDFIFARLILRSQDKITLAVGLYNMVSQRNSTEFTLFAAGAVLLSIPVFVLYFWLQKYLVEGLTAGASKG